MYKILIADDEVIERDYLKSIIKKHPNQFDLVGEACNGVQAMNKAIEKVPDIILMDINMPVCNGLIAARNIKDKLQNSIIILNTAYAEFEYAKQAIDYNINSYLLKPASEEDILNTIQNCINQNNNSNEIPLKYTFTVNKDYPFSIAGNLVNAITNRNKSLVRLSIAHYLSFLESKCGDIEEYKLYIINTIFSVLLAIKETLPQNAYILIERDQYINKICTSRQWNSVIEFIEDLFKKILFILDTTEQPPRSNCTDMIKKYIDKNFEKEISLEILSNIFHYSPSYLSSTFHQEQDITISNYINKVRIAHSISLLEHSSMNVKEIALSCGFINIPHFNRVFKNLTGKTPTDIREGR